MATRPTRRLFGSRVMSSHKYSAVAPVELRTGADDLAQCVADARSV
jgi:hypothetical protein